MNDWFADAPGEYAHPREWVAPKPALSSRSRLRPIARHAWQGSTTGGLEAAIACSSTWRAPSRLAIQRAAPRARGDGTVSARTPVWSDRGAIAPSIQASRFVDRGGASMWFSHRGRRGLERS